MRLQLGPKPGVRARFRQVEGQDEQGNQDLLDVLRAPRLARRTVRPLDAVEEFGSGDGGYGWLAGAGLPKEARQFKLAAFVRDENRGG